MTAASSPNDVFVIRVIAPGWNLSVKGEHDPLAPSVSTSTTILDDTIRVAVPFLLELAVDGAAVAEFVTPETSPTIRVRVQGGDLPRRCESSKRVVVECWPRSVVTEAVGRHVTLDVSGGEPKIHVARR